MDRERVNRVNNHGCFGCGLANPIGLKLVFYRQEHAIEAVFTPQPEHEGYIGIVHGGILATLLDEAMSWAIISATHHLFVTLRIELAFRYPVRVGQEVRVRGWVEEKRGRFAKARAEILDTVEGRRLAEAAGSFVRVAPEQERDWFARYRPPVPESNS